jgi:hypothetical protein
MTPGQTQGLRELARVRAANPNLLEILGDPNERSGLVRVRISLWIGALERRPGGLQFREREQFQIILPAEFPFDYPTIAVDHHRFAGFPHVCWMTILCLYQSSIEWNPADGMYGFLNRLTLWLERAALNQMDPVDGPLEPPHAIIDPSQVPFVIRKDAPAAPGERWIGWALLDRRSNRTELIDWHELDTELPADQAIALAIILSEPLPMEFPQHGEDLFRELLRCGIDRNLLLRLLGTAAVVTADAQPVHIVAGLPMRRAQDGSQRVHIAVWSTSPDYAKSLRLAAPKIGDSEELRTLRKELADSIYNVFEKTTIEWCRVLEDRDEIVVRRDSRTALAWVRGKRILVLGCGALGSWASEIIVRAKPNALHVVDNSIVKPGLLARQNFALPNIGSNKAEALSERLASLSHGIDVHGFKSEAHRFLTEDPERLAGYDLVVDCTASSNFHMKLDRDWLSIRARVRRFISFVTDARAQSLLGVGLASQSADGPWSAYVRLKHRLCMDIPQSDIVRAFYSPRATEGLFQPEPGCSDPTFSASAADVLSIAATALNCLLAHLPDRGETLGMACRLPLADGSVGKVDIAALAPVEAITVSQYRVLISHKTLSRARSCVRQNARLRSPAHETGGLLWGFWDDAAHVIIIMDASEPPPDSVHEPAHFVCGIKGTDEEHAYRLKHSHGAGGFVGLWHTHPDMPAKQSGEDMLGMANLVAATQQNRRRAVMLIFGRDAGRATVGVYVYEAEQTSGPLECVQAGGARLFLSNPVV